MVSPDSDLYRAHPEWVYHFLRRERSTARHQLALNVGRRDVRDHLVATLDALVRDNDIAFLKWDMNRSISEPGWPEQPEWGSEIWVRHVAGVYAILDTLRARHPNLSIESCCSGGGRADYGMLRRTDQIWTSDNTHPVDRLHIQEGFSLVFPPRVMVNWVTDTPQDRQRNEIPLPFRFHVAMLGTLGLGGNLDVWTEDDLRVAAQEVARYKRIRHLLQDGRLAWLRSLRDGVSAAVQFTAPDASEIAVIGFRLRDAYGEDVPPVRLHNLPSMARYRVVDDADGAIVSGAALMHAGLALPFPRGSYASVVTHLARE
jgi:alpha-galactosidase